MPPSDAPGIDLEALARAHRAGEIAWVKEHWGPTQAIKCADYDEMTEEMRDYTRHGVKAVLAALGEQDPEIDYQALAKAAYAAFWNRSDTSDDLDVFSDEARAIVAALADQGLGVARLGDLDGITY